MSIAIEYRPDDSPLPDPALADLVPHSIASELRVVPLRMLGGVLVFAGPSPLSAIDLERLAFILNRRIHAVVRTDDWYRRAKTLLYPDDTEPASSPSSTSWYWGGWHGWSGDTLIVKASGWEGMEHWTGAAEFPRDHCDFDLWCWIVDHPIYHRLIDETEVPAIRRVWKRWLARTKPHNGG